MSAIVKKEPEIVVVSSQPESSPIVKIGIVGAIGALIYFLFFRGSGSDQSDGKPEVSKPKETQPLTFLLSATSSKDFMSRDLNPSDRALFQLVDGKPVQPLLSLHEIIEATKSRGLSEIRLRITGGAKSGHVIFADEFIRNSGLGLTRIEAGPSPGGV